MHTDFRSYLYLVPKTLCLQQITVETKFIIKTIHSYEGAKRFGVVGSTLMATILLVLLLFGIAAVLEEFKY